MPTSDLGPKRQPNGPVPFAAYWDDATVWAGNKILAAIRARPDGTFKVKRFG